MEKDTNNTRSEPVNFKREKKKEPSDPKKKELNELGKRWNPTNQQVPELEEANRLTEKERLALKVSIWELAFHIYYLPIKDEYIGEHAKYPQLSPSVLADAKRNAVFKVIDEAIRGFKPWNEEKACYNLLSGFITSRIGLRWNDILEKEVGGTLSLDDDTRNEDGKGTLESIIGEDDKELEDYRRLDLDTDLLELSSMIFGFTERVNKKGETKVNEIRRNHYRLMFTNDVVYHLKNTARIRKIKHERDICVRMKASYLHYIMSERCKNLHDVYVNKLKKYGKVVKVEKNSRYRGDEEIPLPIPNLVPATYLNKTGANSSVSAAETAYSTNLQRYNEFLDQL